ncbi:cell division/GTP binding protein [Lichtheimia hyalospora FSU 10163]|nr:cell division/GTP binding protein [Lichtheimia hyalospora FSU 10163]
MAPRSRRNAVSHFNVMVVGSAGVGKTSFVKTLLAALKTEMPKKKRDSAVGPSESDMCKDPTHGPLSKTLAPYTISSSIEVDGDKVMLTVIDTPGFYDDFRVDKQLHDILGYIEHQFDLTLAEENKVKRNPKASDTQVHACLYLLDPIKPALGEYDIRILTQLSKRVNVIPVVSKADNLTAAQRRRLKPSIIHDIYNKHKIPLYGMPEDESEEEEEDSDDNNDTKGNDNATTSATGSLEEFLDQFDYDNEDEETQTFIDYLRMVPFTTIAYEDDPDTGAPLAMKNGINIGRDYGWVQIDCLSDKFSDFAALKTMLLSTHRRILQSETIERYYEQYRTERLLVRRATKLKSMDVGKKLLADLNQL